MIAKSREFVRASDHPDPIAERPTADAADVWWHRWSLGPLPMVRATVRPQTRIKAVNQALVNQLGYSVNDTSSIVRSLITALQSYSEATQESTVNMPEPRLMTLDVPRRDGTTLSLRMFLVAHAGRQANEWAVVGVGMPSTQEARS